MGDSYISGESGRWMGNSNGYFSVPRNSQAQERSDRGEKTYWDKGNSESHPGCHRSDRSEIDFGGPINSINLACSGATTADIQIGSMQLTELAQAAHDHHVELVALSIGGNDVGFGSITEACVQDYILSAKFWRNMCMDDSNVQSKLDAAHLENVRQSIAKSIGAIITTMRDAGVPDDQWSLIVQNYPSPVPSSGSVRYEEGGINRITQGGCPLSDRDLDWVNDTALPLINTTVKDAATQSESAYGKTIHVLDVTHAFNGRRLCETDTRLVEETSSPSQLVDVAERVSQIRLLPAIDTSSPYAMQEALHPNYFGQAALRHCLRQAWNDGNPSSGTCSAPSNWGLTDSRDEPLMTFTRG